MKYLLFQEVEKYAKLVDSIQYNSQKVDTDHVLWANSEFVSG